MSKDSARKAPARRKSSKKAAARRSRAIKPARGKKAGRKEGKKGAQVAEAREVVEVKLVPAPRVIARHEREMIQRGARGYSLGELESAGIAFVVAKKAGVPLDARRRSVLDANVESLKGWYVPPPKAVKKEKEGEGAEEGGAKKKEKKKQKKARKVSKPKSKKE